MSDKVKKSTKLMQVFLVIVAVAVIGFGFLAAVSPSTQEKEIPQYDNDF